MDLASRWASAWQSLGAAPDKALFQALMLAHREPHRHYHTLQHLEECFTSFDLLKADAQHAAAIELALWFHDAIYDPRRHDSEERSAQWARNSLFPVSRDAAERVHRLVMATKHDALPQATDGQVVVDVDLSILGAPQERFDEYERQVREEYAWVPIDLYRRERRRILKTFFDRTRIFNTAAFVERFEERARRNLERVLARL